MTTILFPPLCAKRKRNPFNSFLPGLGFATLLHLSLLVFILSKAPTIPLLALSSSTGVTQEVISIDLIKAGSFDAGAASEQPVIPVLETELPLLPILEQGELVAQSPDKQPLVKTPPVQKVVKPVTRQKTPTQKLITEKSSQSTESSAEQAKNTAGTQKGEGGQAEISAQGGSPSPTQGSLQTGVDNSAISSYQAKLRAEIDRHKNYPSRSRRMQETGIVEVSMHVGAEGNLSQIKVTQSSGNSSLDDAALNAVQQSRPVGARPEGMDAWQTLDVKFTL